MSTSRCRLRPTAFLMSIEAAPTSHLARLDALAVEAGRARLGLPPGRLSSPLAQRIVDADPGVVGGPLVVVVAEGAPGARAPGNQPPLAAGPGQGENAVHQVAQVGGRWGTGAGGCRQFGLDERPLGVGQVGRRALFGRESGQRETTSSRNPAGPAPRVPTTTLTHEGFSERCLRRIGAGAQTATRVGSRSSLHTNQAAPKRDVSQGPDVAAGLKRLPRRRPTSGSEPAWPYRGRRLDRWRPARVSSSSTVRAASHTGMGQSSRESSRYSRRQ